MALYTGLRVALFAGVWLLVQVITPLRGLMAIAVALVISGVISFIVLDRSRNRASVGLAGFFKRIDDRIERSRTAEDADDPTPASASGQGESDAEKQAVGQDQEAGRLQDRDQGAPGGSAHDSGHGSNRKDRRPQGEPREGQAES